MPRKIINPIIQELSNRTIYPKSYYQNHDSTSAQHSQKDCTDQYFVASLDKEKSYKTSVIKCTKNSCVIP